MAAPLPVSDPPAPLPPLQSERSVLVWNLAALLTAGVAVAGSLVLSLGLKLHACPLCYYQRSFAIGTAAVLVMAMLTDQRGSASASLLALPLAIAGLGVACWHVYLELIGRLECPPGLLGLGTSPQQSLTVFVLLVLFLGLGALRRPAMGVALILGGCLAWACVISVAPLKLPEEAFQGAPVICRPPRT